MFQHFVKDVTQGFGAHGADEATLDCACFVDEEFFRYAGNAIVEGDASLDVNHDWIGDVELSGEGCDGIVGVPDCDAYEFHGQVRIFSVDLGEDGGFSAARRAPGTPEVQHDDFASMLFQVDGGDSIEVWQ